MKYNSSACVKNNTLWPAILILAEVRGRCIILSMAPISLWGFKKVKGAEIGKSLWQF